MKRFLIHVHTYWCGEDDIFRAVAESKDDLCIRAEQLAYENFISYDDHDEAIAEDNGYDPETMTDTDWDDLWEKADESMYYNFNIEEFDGDDEEWEEFEGEIYKA